MTDSPPGADRTRTRTRPRTADAGPPRRKPSVDPRFRYHRVFGARPPSEWPCSAAFGMRAMVTEEDVRATKPDATPEE